MNIPRFWVRARANVRGTRGRTLALAAWGWSSNNRADAESKAHERLGSLVARVEQGLELPRGYGYGQRPLREEILEELRAPAGEILAVVTRNGYGSLILNTARAMFVDVDLPTPSSASRLRAWFGGNGRKAEAETLERLRNVLRGGGSFRVYRTAAGFRVLATDPVFAPGSSDAETLMTQVGADPAFVQLCRVQESFRARLTPKPWRCGCKRSPLGYPREQAQDEEKFAKWRERYARACAPKATCRLVEEIGWRRVHSDVAPIVDIHDRLTKIDSNLPLA